MSDAASIAAHVLENLRRARRTSAHDLAPLWPCWHCKAAVGEPCRSPSGAPFRPLHPFWPGVHQRRINAVYDARSSWRLRDLEHLLEHEPERAVMRMGSCALYRRIAPRIWSVPSPRSSRPVTTAELARAGEVLRRALARPGRDHDGPRLGGDDLAIVLTVRVRRAFGLSDLPKAGLA